VLRQQRDGELVGAHALDLGALDQALVERLRHPDQQPPAVLGHGRRLRHGLTGQEHRFQPRDHRFWKHADGFFHRFTGRHAARKIRYLH
jgi:hypothetical protein